MSDQSLLSRRRFLRWTLGGVGLIAAGAGGLLALRGSAPAVAGLKVLSDHEYRTFAAVAGAVIPRGGPFPEGAADMDLARAFDDFLADEPAEQVKDAKRALLLVDYGPLIFEARLTTFTRLDEAERTEHWAGWTRSRLGLRRRVAVGFRGFVSMLFYDRPELWPRLNYPGPALARR